MVTSRRIQGREQLAWMVLLSGFFICTMITIATPILFNQFVQRATKPLTIEALANQGTVGISDEETGTRALFAGNLPLAVDVGNTVRTDVTDTALLSLLTPNDEELLGRIQVYADTHLTVLQADTPRFSWSDAGNVISLFIHTGRVRIQLSSPLSRSLVMSVETPQGKISLLTAGHYSLDVTNASTQVAVLAGEAVVTAQGEMLQLDVDERGVINADSFPTGPLPTERNLIHNGDFTNDWQEWVVLDWNVERDDEPVGETEIVSRNGESVLVMRRVGIGHADSGIRQIINQDVTDFTSLELLLNLRINQQTLGVCGFRGSECPLMVRIDYNDENGNAHEWLQGFYASGEITVDTPDICVFCSPPRNSHIFFSSGQIKFYESGNLLTQLQQQDIQLSRINNISLIAAGHGFDVEVMEVALLATE